jgi:hypothetical protein
MLFNLFVVGIFAFVVLVGGAVVILLAPAAGWLVAIPPIQHSTFVKKAVSQVD